MRHLSQCGNGPRTTPEQRAILLAFLAREYQMGRSLRELSELTGRTQTAVRRASTRSACPAGPGAPIPPVVAPRLGVPAGCLSPHAPGDVPVVGVRRGHRTSAHHRHRHQRPPPTPTPTPTPTRPHSPKGPGRAGSARVSVARPRGPRPRTCPAQGWCPGPGGFAWTCHHRERDGSAGLRPSCPVAQYGRPHSARRGSGSGRRR